MSESAFPMRTAVKKKKLVPAFILKKHQLEEDIGPRLVAMVRNIEASLGMH